jgi:uncharacterized membrane protein YkvA (DUF1232 family)
VSGSDVRDTLLVALIVIGAALVLLLLAGVFVAWRVRRSQGGRVIHRVKKLPFRAKMAFVRDVLRDPRVPFWPRLLALMLVLYIASPIDLIPDFIPVLGQLDDLLVATVLGWLLVRSIPADVIEERLSEREAAEEQRRLAG